ncbi:MAG: hypothetical protein AAB547_02695 [Patescibacteria group bacterium]
MHDYALLRESLANVSQWRGRRVIVHVDLGILNKEKYTSPIISDVLFLHNAGIEMTFSCAGIGAAAFVQKASARGVNTVMIDTISDIVGLADRLNAVKVFFLCEGDGVYDHRHMLVREMTSQEAASMLQGPVVHGAMSEKVRLAVRLCEGGRVQRVHFANGRKEGALLDEFLSSKGSGTMIYRDDPPYKMVRQAVSDDAVGIAHMIRDTVDSSIVEEVVLRRVSDCRIFTVDGHIHAVAMSSYEDGVIKVGYLAHSSEFDASEVLYVLLQHIIDEAARCGARKITIEPNRAPILIGIWPWFLKLGFQKSLLASGTNHKLWEKSLEP